MAQTVIEAEFPLTFRQNDTEQLGKHLKNRNSVVLIGMKRVGISTFLRFFLHHNQVIPIYISKTEKHLFIPVNLNDLVEREIFPFWRLTFKRIVDASETFALNTETKTYIQNLFSGSIQSQDLFLTIDGARKSLQKLVSEGIMPTLFFLWFDRIIDAATPEFFANLQGLQAATHRKLSYVFTAYRRLDILSSEVFKRASLSTFSHDMYIKPAGREDMGIVYQAYKKEYNLAVSKEIEQAIFDFVDGYIQYLQLVLIFIREGKKPVKTKAEFRDYLLADERINLQSEELWESLTPSDQSVVVKVSQGEPITQEEKRNASYLWETGIIHENESGIRAIFSPLFDYYLKQKAKKSEENNNVEFSKKEHLLFMFLKDHINEICEREKIIEAVWPEVEALGVSDWAIDRLVARVRNKLKLQKSPYEVQTIKTRGYKLISL